MIWDVSTTNAILDLVVSYRLSDEALATCPDPSAYIRKVEDEMFRNLENAAHTYAVDIHRDDTRTIQVAETPGLYGTVTKVVMRWYPESEAVEFRDGPYDGQVMVLAPDPYNNPLHQRFIIAKPEEPNSMARHAARKIDTTLYVLEGWNENTRHFIFGPKPEWKNVA
jgi:hypothetical protein